MSLCEFVQTDRNTLRSLSRHGWHIPNVLVAIQNLQPFKAWKARLNEGVNPETMLEGVKRYAGWVSAMGNSGTQFVKQAVTFFGPDRHFEESREVPAVSAARREDPYFKASYDNVDYSQIPAGFRG